MINAFPLCWPEGWKRTPGYSRKRAAFGRVETQRQGDVSWKKNKQLSVMDAVQRVLAELERMGIRRDDVIISTNVPTRLDGLPRSDSANPSDPGAAAYFRKSQNAPMRCMAIDRYDRVADNLAAIATTLEAMRTIERHGGAEILDRAFTGFAALPQNTGRPWRDVLALPPVCNMDRVEQRYRELAMNAHPDRGGSEAAMQELNAARDQARAELGAK
jgi:hypothetical protein